MESNNNEQTKVRQVLQDVYEDINWAYLAQRYFGKSRSWLYHKFSGMNNGKPDDFSDIDREKLLLLWQYTNDSYFYIGK